MQSLLATIASVQTYPLGVKLIIVFLAGLLPVLMWLWFWEHEDKHPEPHKLVLIAFLAGMGAVAVSLALEMAFTFKDYTLTLIVWAAIEELVKFGAAYYTVLSRAENDEPIDSMMYMITVALGFAALENALFLFKPIYYGHLGEALTTGNLRFIGATLLHTITSGIIGLALALAFYKKPGTRRGYLIAGVITAIALHALFNLSIIALEGSYAVVPLYGVWIAIVVILLAFEKVKQITG